ncbi:MAG TPA: FliH/SctL family protein [Steroidobacteraceae bacterium]|nr:FliH/SctL family protein [Steroidobacteraceae bacterium]
MSERTAADPRTIERWSPPTVGDAVLPRRREARAAGQSAAASGADQAQAAGYAAGLERAQREYSQRLAELDGRIRSLDALLRQLAQPLRALDAEVEQALLRLATAIGSQLARRALRTEPGQLIALLRECLKELPLGARAVRVHLHPADAKVLEERLAGESESRAWQLVEDPTLTRGGLLVQSESSLVDARFESRVNALIVQALGDERATGRLSDGAAAPVDAAGSP